MYRTYRIDKYRIALLENILRTYINSSKVLDKNLSIYFFNRSIEKLKNSARTVVDNINESQLKKINIQIEPTFVEAGSGSLPTEKISSVAISIKSNDYSANQISKKLRHNKIPIITYIKNDKVFIDFKAIPESQYYIIWEAINTCL